MGGKRDHGTTDKGQRAASRSNRGPRANTTRTGLGVKAWRRALWGLLLVLAAPWIHAQRTAFIVPNESRVDRFHREMINLLNVRKSSEKPWGCSLSSYGPFEYKPGEAQKLGLKKQAYVYHDVREVRAGSPADMAGLVSWDRLLMLNGQPFSREQSIADQLNGFPAGEPIQVTFLRRGQIQHTTVVADSPLDVVPVAKPDLFRISLGKGGELTPGQRDFLQSLGMDQVVMLARYELRISGEAVNPFDDHSGWQLDRSVQYAATYRVTDLRSGRSQELPMQVMTQQPGCQRNMATCSNFKLFRQQLFAFSQNTMPAQASPASTAPTAGTPPPPDAPTILVWPQRARTADLLAGTFQPTRPEKLLMASIQEYLGDAGFTTIDFEAARRKLQEARLVRSTATDLDDLPTWLMDAAQGGLVLEFGKVDLGTYRYEDPCQGEMEFRVRNTATAMNVATEIHKMNLCYEPGDYKDIVRELFDEGLRQKLDREVRRMATQGRRVTVEVLLTNGRRTADAVNGQPLARHFEEALKELLPDGRFAIQGTLDHLMRFSGVDLPAEHPDTDEAYTTNAFALDLAEGIRQRTGLAVRPSLIGSNVILTVE